MGVKLEGYIPIAGSPIFVENYVRQWTQEERNHFADLLHGVCDEMRKRTSRETLLAAFDSIGHYVKEQIATCEKPVSCVKGCGRCCYIAVTCTNPEAKLALEHAKKKGLHIDIGRLKYQVLKGTSDDDFIRMPPDMRKCVFLQKDETCGIYEVRPTACRLMYSVTERHMCHSLLNPDGMYEALVSYWGEITQALYRSAIVLNYGEENLQPMHNFLFKWCADGLLENTGAVPEHEKPMEPAGLPPT